MWKLFVGPVVASVIVLTLVGVLGGMSAIMLAIFLTFLEVSLSFDNAVINAKVLMRMEEVWRKRFLTWGMVIAVLGARLVIPVMLVSIAGHVAPWTLLVMLIGHPDGYTTFVEQAAPIIRAFGGAFLMMVALRYFFDEAKQVHWIRVIERRLAVWGRVEAIEVLLTMCAVLGAAWVLPELALPILVAGMFGIMLFIVLEGVVHLLGASASALAPSGVGLFVYLSLLDVAFSLDGVVGAFALTTQVLVIVAGLSIGAYLVRTLTIFFVHRRTLTTLMYLEHGAYWAIGALAFCMFVSIGHDLPDVFVGTISILFIGAAYFSSLRESRLHPAATL